VIAALVDACLWNLWIIVEANSWFFLRRTPTMIYVRESHVEKMGKIQDVAYEILNVLEFNR
jgi:hypothetical protein